MRARSCSPYQAVACAVVTAAACWSVRPVGSVAARSVSHVTNVPQQPLGEMPPTRSPTWWVVTSLPTAVTTPAKSVPSCGSRPSKDGYRPNVTRTSAKLMLEALTATSISLDPGGTRSNAVSSIVWRSPGVRICNRIPSCRGSAQCGEPLFGPQRAGEQARGVPVAVSPGGLVLFRSAEQWRASCSASVRPSRSICVTRQSGYSCQASGASRAIRLAPGWPVRRRHRLRVAGHHEQLRWLAVVFGQPFDDADQMLHVVAAPRCRLVVGVPVLRPGEYRQPLNEPR